MPEDQDELIVSPDKLDSFLVVFGIEVDDEEHLVKMDTGEELKSAKGNEITTGQAPTPKGVGLSVDSRSGHETWQA